MLKIFEETRVFSYLFYLLKFFGIYVSDSDDYMSDLKLLSVNLVDDLWYLDSANEYGYSGWFIGRDR